MAVPVASTDSGYPLHIDVGEVPAEDGGRPVRGFAEAERLKSLDLDSRRAVRVGAIDDAGMDEVPGLVLGCLVTPDMAILPGC